MRRCRSAFGLDDVCAQHSIRLSTNQRTIRDRALLPADGYYCTFALPSLATNPDLFSVRRPSRSAPR